ncbi:uncharacterized protein LOC108603970 [Drosophila busckii]|uniref:uncharacterized protein LOC108603970 n=1 Tax=Drosophila busckii TaxID=30019 RepID=UPI00083EFC91|nr:uncharacterized protein LOC108603970 [Drosophila busckii]XP_033149861.1 uncharacterized protein LOC108603970 [Drosophila busckii]XP_033149862.1 uncharacterized protein LOC108603970 [Drosophila busckii]
MGSTSDRLKKGPIAELQLKSFKLPAETGPWYEVHNEHTSQDSYDKLKEENLAKEQFEADKNATKETKLYNESPERAPSYFNGEGSTPQDTPRPKRSISFFVSFDGDDKKETYKIPKRFLTRTDAAKNKQFVSNNGKSSNSNDPKTVSLNSMSDEECAQLAKDLSHEQYGVQKLQTIHELNENESSNELRTDDENVTDYENVEVKPLIEPNSNLEAIGTENSKLNRSAQIIQKAYRNYKSLQAVNIDKACTKDNCERNANETLSISPDVKDQTSKNLAAIIIQKAARRFLQNKQQTKSCNSSTETTECLTREKAALIIQNAFLNYLQRKKLESRDDRSEDSYTSSLITAVPLNDVESSPSLSLTLMDTELNANSIKSEWFVGTQPIVLESSGTAINDNQETSTSIDLIAPESTNNTKVNACIVADRNDDMHESKLTSDIGNNINELTPTQEFKNDNGASNNLAGSSNEAVLDVVEDLADKAFAAVSPCLKDGTKVSPGQLLHEFLTEEIEFSSMQQNNDKYHEVQEEPCIKKCVSRTSLDQDQDVKLTDGTISSKIETEVNIDDNIQGIKSINELQTLSADALDEATAKLSKPDEVIEKMARRRSSELLEQHNDEYRIAETSFDEPVIHSMGSIQDQSSLDIEDGDIILYKRLQRDETETRESSAQSESVVFGMADAEQDFISDTEANRPQLLRHYTIAGDKPHRIFRSETMDETGNEMEELEGYLDDETSENIRKKIMAYSLSDGDSDDCDAGKLNQEDFNIDTALADAMDTSTETESTIVSAATRIQAGARGFLTRRRLRRASAGTKSSTQETKASFGNDAISESLERFIEEEAAKKIQNAYRFHNKRHKKKANVLKSSSLESSLAAKRLTLQRGDALRNDSNSTPEDDHGSATNISGTKISSTNISGGAAIESVDEKNNSKNVVRAKRNTTGLKWPVLRQNSMPVQIECEVLRLIPKHLRKRVKSAENGRKVRK